MTSANNKTTKPPLQQTIHVSFFSIWLLMINQFTQQPTSTHLNCYPINSSIFLPDIVLILIASAFWWYMVLIWSNSSFLAKNTISYIYCVNRSPIWPERKLGRKNFYTSQFPLWIRMINTFYSTSKFLHKNMYAV